VNSMLHAWAARGTRGVASAYAFDAVRGGCEVRILDAVMSKISAFATALKHWL